MTPGIPGAGIGGLFYILASVALTLRHGFERLTGRSAPRATRAVAVLLALAGGVAGGVWIMGWLLGFLVTPGALGAATQGGMLQASPQVQNVIRKTALIVGAATLASVLLAVEVARLWQRARRPRTARVRPMLLVLLMGGAGSLPAQQPLVARADSAFEAEDRALARSLYERVLRDDPHHSRAVFQLARLERDAAKARVLYERYVQLEPDDAWGYAALGDHLARAGLLADAIAAYERGVRLAPDAGDLWDRLGRLQLRSGRPVAAAHAFERAGSGAAARLRLARSQSAPALEPLAGYQRDSDGNSIARIGMAGDVMLADGVRAGATVSRGDVRDAAESIPFQSAILRLLARPSPNVRLTSEAGVTAFDATRGAWSAPQADVRLRWQAPNEASLELRGQHLALAASPLLVYNRVSRSDARAVLQLPAGPLQLRGELRAGVLQAAGESPNRRVDAAGALVFPLRTGSEATLRYQTVSFARASAAGYFAPQLAQTMEAGSYFEAGEDGPWSLAADLGIGMQRLALQGEAAGGWNRALRAWAYAAYAMAPARALWLELEAYDSPFAPLGVSAAPSWRYLSLASGLRWSLR